MIPCIRLIFSIWSFYLSRVNKWWKGVLHVPNLREVISCNDQTEQHSLNNINNQSEANNNNKNKLRNSWSKNGVGSGFVLREFLSFVSLNSVVRKMQKETLCKVKWGPSSASYLCLLVYTKNNLETFSKYLVPLVKQWEQCRWHHKTNSTVIILSEMNISFVQSVCSVSFICQRILPILV